MPRRIGHMISKEVYSRLPSLITKAHCTKDGNRNPQTTSAELSVLSVREIDSHVAGTTTEDAVGCRIGCKDSNFARGLLCRRGYLQIYGEASGSDQWLLLDAS